MTLFELACGTFVVYMIFFYKQCDKKDEEIDYVFGDFIDEND
jgi:hypothetical protein